MEDDWISDAFDEEVSEGDFDAYDEVRQAIRTNNYEKEIIVVQDGAGGRALTRGLTDFGIVKTTIVRTQEITI